MTQKKTKDSVVSVVEFSIVDDIPVPDVSRGRGKYPFEQLIQGQSFLVACASKDAKKMKANLASAARRVKESTGAEFLVLYRPEEKGLRCWCVKGKEEPVDVPPEDNTDTSTPAVSDDFVPVAQVQ